MKVYLSKRRSKIILSLKNEDYRRREKKSRNTRLGNYGRTFGVVKLKQF